MPSTPRQFQPRLPLTVGAALAVALFCGLGLWQLDRAAQKRELALRMEMRQGLPPVRLVGGDDRFEDLEFRTVLARGRFYPQRQIFIENRKHLGQGGFHVVSPLKVEGSDRYLLVNRGWVAAAPGRDEPAVATPPGVVEVSGEAVIPSPPAIDLRPDKLPEAQRRWPFLTLDGYAAWSGLPIYPFLLLQSGDEPGFARAWKRVPPSDAMHLGYAIQWFAFALIVLAIWYRLSLSRRGPTEARRP